MCSVMFLLTRTSLLVTSVDERGLPELLLDLRNVGLLSCFVTRFHRSNLDSRLHGAGRVILIGKS
jgi:hypothetical protein